MTYFSEIQSKEELKKVYRRLSLINHPDKGGAIEVMQNINNEYTLIKNTFGVIPEKLETAKIGNFVFVNRSMCMVVGINNEFIKAKSLKTKREAFFDKRTGYGLFNFNIKAYV